MASLAYAQPFRCPSRDLLLSEFKALLDVYRQCYLSHLESVGIGTASLRSEPERVKCEAARDALVRHCKEHGCLE
jgi:hypothetical protein